MPLVTNLVQPGAVPLTPEPRPLLTKAKAAGRMAGWQAGGVTGGLGVGVGGGNVA